MKTALFLLTLPALIAFGAAMSFHYENRSNGTIVSGGVEREYLLYVPRSYDGTKAVPLVISLHGAGGWPTLQRDISQWNDIADREGFIVVYPAGMRAPGPRVWRPSDVPFIADLIDKLQRDYRIDPRRIYVNGLSNGGGMSFVLSCRLSDRIAAAGLVGAALILHSKWCRNEQPVPMIAFHGTADNAALYNGGTSWVVATPLQPVESFVADWARRNRCSPQPADTPYASDIRKREYRGCADGAPVVLYTIDGGGHTWPGPGGPPVPEWFMGRTARNVNASELMWEFFKPVVR